MLYFHVDYTMYVHRGKLEGVNAYWAEDFVRALMGCCIIAV